MRPYILAESNWKVVKDQVFDLAILPWGATEAHNYHLPYGTDIFEADFFAAEGARLAWERGAQVIVLPTIPFGVNTGQADIRLDINMNPSTQAAVISDVVTVLNRQGIRKLLIFNSHGGNDFKTILREIGLRFPNMLLCSCNWYEAIDRSAYFEQPGDHAGEMETNLMLYLNPDLVLALSEAGPGIERKHQIAAFKEKWAWAERKWSQVTDDTGVGNPVAASSEKGEAYAQAVVRKLGDFIYDLSKADPAALYA